ncbi:hypothetical protein LTR67_008040 [Exophiala xenobiotica]|nr:hypothetical protein H2202_001242 [Exophiala xenobiotica]KAK5208932.1 hypothetical protein LTR41_005329 [Exophiala xenobiotica]KAK5234052.1 hypothetical protein LTR47_004641 [Exophiala xenobiotica]KAK5253123.1 hypothetical protein LTS06_002327 [Exophiala xenobiotica]KAK5258965.1 hypothetical protein LTR40_006856 [Exophiala xenobiotica]
MHFSMNTLVLATLAAGQAYAASISHQQHSAFHSHARKHNHVEQKRATALTDADATKLTALGVASLGVNSAVSNGQAWLAEDGPYKANFQNNAGEDLVLVCWGVAGSWINAVQPTITASIAAGSSLTVSFADGASGACTAVYGDTQLVNGQASNTWMEFTFGDYGVVDVSREVNMNGHSLSVVGPSCTTDMDTCVFVCPSGDVCTFGYELKNCANGSQPGANYGTYAGAPSGGCGGMGSSATLAVSWS